MPPLTIPPKVSSFAAAGSHSVGASARPPARVVIVEDEPAFCDVLTRCLATTGEFVVVGVAGTLADGLALLAQAPDLLLVDLVLPDGTGIDLIQKIHTDKNPCRSLVVSVLGDVGTVVRAIKAGADGYLLKAGGDAEQVLSALRTVLAGGAPISPAIARHILCELRTGVQTRQQVDKSKLQLALTPRELEILHTLAKGLSYKETARLHGISHHTVAEHVKVIYKKLEVNSRAEAVFEAMHSGIIRMRE